jgi:alkanesulfonate monooxygenase SsuD/methylene tetrahydromethanopterin reductase-like flavin-dependent oxidoreductase (luciferase family)
MKTKLGYLIPTRENIMSDDHGVDGLLERAKMVEQLGYESLWVGDSLFARPRHDPLTMLAALGAVTSRVQIGSAVLLPALRNPVVLAQQLATIDQIAGGRLIVGAGIAADTPRIREEFEAASVPFEKRVGRLVEGFALCRELWTGEPVTWSGRWEVKAATLAPRPAQLGGPPIWLAAGVPAGIRRCAQFYEGWMPIGPNVEGFQTGLSQLKEASDEFGRPVPTASIYLTVCVAENEQTAEAQIDEYLAEYYGMPPRIMRSIQACCGGSLSKVTDFIGEFAQAGAQHIILRLVGNHESTLQQLASHNSSYSSLG